MKNDLVQKYLRNLVTPNSKVCLETFGGTGGADDSGSTTGDFADDGFGVTTGDFADDGFGVTTGDEPVDGSGDGPDDGGGDDFGGTGGDLPFVPSE